MRCLLESTASVDHAQSCPGQRLQSESDSSSDLMRRPALRVKSVADLMRTPTGSEAGHSCIVLSGQVRRRHPSGSKVGRRRAATGRFSAGRQRQSHVGFTYTRGRKTSNSD
jgi:hypothetical protein